MFFTFLGFYSAILLGINTGMSGFTRQLAIPIRAVIGFSSILLYFIGFRNKAPYLKWFVLFTFIYIVRIFIDYSKYEFFYISYADLLFYFISFVIIPFFGVSRANFQRINFNVLYKVFLLSALIFSFLSIFIYGRFVGEVGRISESSTGESVISPLILSYCGALIIGVLSVYLIYNFKKTSKITILLSFGAIIMAVIPFFLGASRGGIFAIFVPFILMGASNLSLKSIIKYSLLVAVLIIGMIYLDDYLGSGLLSRFTGTAEAIETGGSSASRLGIWSISFSQFVDNPLFGDRLNTIDINHYPHNIFLEVLQALGLIGFIPFIVLVIKGLKASIYIFKYHAIYSWIPVIFIQAMMQNTFTGAMYTSAWFWTSMAMVLSLNYYLKKNEIAKK